MYLLVFIQNNQETPLALFESIDEGRKFARAIPGYRVREETIEDYRWEYELFDPLELPDYIEIEHNGNLVPITKFMFRDEDEVEIIWREIPNLEKPNQGLVNGQTLVDAYIINNKELNSYITKREHIYEKIKTLLEKRGYDVERSYRGSEDGEAVLYKKRNDNNWHFLMHMDPSFVDDVPVNDEELERWLDEYEFHDTSSNN